MKMKTNKVGLPVIETKKGKAEPRKHWLSDRIKSPVVFRPSKCPCSMCSNKAGQAAAIYAPLGVSEKEVTWSLAKLAVEIALMNGIRAVLHSNQRIGRVRLSVSTLVR